MFMDGSNPETISKYITPVYHGLKAQGGVIFLNWMRCDT